MGKRAVSRLMYCYSILLTLIVGALAVCGRLGGHYSAEHSTFLCVMALLLPAVLVVNALLAVYWALRLKVWVLIPIVCIACNSGYLRSVFQVKQPVSTDMPKSLIVSSYNVASFNNEPTGYSCKAIAGYLKDCRVDIACFQEFGINREFNEDSVRRAMSHWKYCSIPHTTDGHSILQTAIFSRYPIIDTRLIAFRGTTNCSMVCHILVGGDTITVVNNHLQTTAARKNNIGSDKLVSTYKNGGLWNSFMRLYNGLIDNAVVRSQQAEYMSHVVKESKYRTIVCGDLNSLPSEYVYRRMRGNNLEDGFRMAGSGYMYTYRFMKHLLRIDYIFVPKTFKGYMYASPNLDYSDHKPVIMAMGYE